MKRVQILTNDDDCMGMYVNGDLITEEGCLTVWDVLRVLADEDVIEHYPWIDVVVAQGQIQENGGCPYRWEDVEEDA